MQVPLAMERSALLLEFSDPTSKVISDIYEIYTVIDSIEFELRRNSRRGELVARKKNVGTVILYD